MRIRTVKPGLFKNEILGAADPIHTLLFIGLWCLADRKGRLEDRPLRIRNELFPQRKIDVDAGLAVLEKGGFINRYVASNTKYIQILAFEKHQHIHSNEAPSSIPPPETSGNSSTSAGIPSDSLIDGETERLIDGKTEEQLAAAQYRADMAMIMAPIEGLNVDAWNQFIGYRKKIRKPIRDVSYPLAMKELVEFGDEAMQAAVVQQTIANGWQGLFALKPKPGMVQPSKVRVEDIKL